MKKKIRGTDKSLKDWKTLFTRLNYRADQEQNDRNHHVRNFQRQKQSAQISPKAEHEQ
jgi:hypothetical protein